MEQVRLDLGFGILAGGRPVISVAVSVSVLAGAVLGLAPRVSSDRRPPAAIVVSAGFSIFLQVFSDASSETIRSMMRFPSFTSIDSGMKRGPMSTFWSWPIRQMRSPIRIILAGRQSISTTRTRVAAVSVLSVAPATDMMMTRLLGSSWNWSTIFSRLLSEPTLPS